MDLRGLLLKGRRGGERRKKGLKGERKAAKEGEVEARGGRHISRPDLSLRDATAAASGPTGSWLNPALRAPRNT